MWRERERERTSGKEKKSKQQKKEKENRASNVIKPIRIYSNRFDYIIIGVVCFAYSIALCVHRQTIHTKLHTARTTAYTTYGNHFFSSFSLRCCCLCLRYLYIETEWWMFFYSPSTGSYSFSCRSRARCLICLRNIKAFVHFLICV